MSEEMEQENGNLASDYRCLIDLFAAVRRGDLAGWHELVRRLGPSIQSVITYYGLSRQDAEDVAQAVWLRLLDNLNDIQNPIALPKWVAVTARNECIEVFCRRRRVLLVDTWHEDAGGPTVIRDCGARIIEHEQHQVLQEAMRTLSDTQRQLLILLMEEPAPSYTEISSRLRIPVGSIGPTRARALDNLRRSRSLSAWYQCSEVAYR